MPRSFLKASAALVYPLMAIYAFLLVPAYEIIAFDVTLSGTLLFDAIDMLMGWVEIIVLSLMTALLTVAVSRTGTAKACRALYVLLGGAFLLKYIGGILSLSIVHGALDSTLNYFSYFISFVLELLPLVLATALTHRYTVAAQSDAAARRKALARLGSAPEKTVDHLPFDRFFDRHNPLQRFTLLSIGVITAFRLLAYIMSEIAYVIQGFSFTLRDLPITLLYALLTVLLPCFLGYLLTRPVTKTAKHF